MRGQWARPWGGGDWADADAPNLWWKLWMQVGSNVPKTARTVRNYYDAGRLDDVVTDVGCGLWPGFFGLRERDDRVVFVPSLLRLLEGAQQETAAEGNRARSEKMKAHGRAASSLFAASVLAPSEYDALFADPPPGPATYDLSPRPQKQ